MRPGQNKRMRGRNRRGPNPLSRSYESNGPDVKIRGSAAHIAEKYVQLARDAHAGGDPVAAESYLQHAEHYLRIIASAQQQIAQQNGFVRDEDRDDSDEDDYESDASDRFTFRPPQMQGQQGQFGEREGGYDRQNGDRPNGERQDRQQGGQAVPGRGEQPRMFERPQYNGDRQERPQGERGERHNGERGERGERHNGDRFDRNNRFDRNQERAERRQPEHAAPEPERPAPAVTADRTEGQAGLPAFITGTRGAPEGEQPEGDLRSPFRARRRRRGRGIGPEAEGGAEASETPDGVTTAE